MRAGRRGMRWSRIGAALALTLAGGCQTTDSPSFLRRTMFGDSPAAAAADVHAAPSASPQVTWQHAVPGQATDQVVWRGAAPEKEMEADATASSWRPLTRMAGPAAPTGVVGNWQGGSSNDGANTLPLTPTGMRFPPGASGPQLTVPSTKDASPTLNAPRPLPSTAVTPEIVIGPTMMPVNHGGPGLAPKELAKVTLPPYKIDPPDILSIEYGQELAGTSIHGPHLVRPDGSVSLGVHGSVTVAGMTIDQARRAIAEQIAQSPKLAVGKFKPDEVYADLVVDVVAYNSKVYYVITDGGGYGEQVYPIPIKGYETVLDALGMIGGLPPVASKRRIWIARRTPQGGNTLPVDWIGITQGGAAATNYQIMPGDRIYVKAEKLIRIDSGVAKVLSPFERMLGATLLGSSAVNSIRNPNATNGTVP